MNARPLISWLTLGLTALALSGCGGGKQVEKFRPSKIVSFGDESSAFVPEASDNVVDGKTVKGFKYTVNYLEVNKSYIRGTTALSPIVFSDPIDKATVGDTYLIQPTWVNFPDTTPPGTAPVTWVPVGLTGNDVFYIERTFQLDVDYKDKAGAKQTINKPITYQYGYSCVDNRIWIQLLANSYGMSYSTACPLDTRTGAVSYAQAGAKVADVITQITTNMGSIGSNTLATVLAGQNDVLEQYDSIFPASATSAPADGTTQTAENVLKNRAIQLAQAINGIADKRARTLVLTLPDLSYSPRVRAPSVNLQLERAAVMTRLVRAFNDALFSEGGVRNDGRVIGRVKVYELTQEMATYPSSYGLVDGTTAACATNLRSIDTTSSVTLNTSADLKYCNDGTLITGATAYNRLWAWDTWLSPVAHAAISNRAFQRADNDVF